MIANIMQNTRATILISSIGDKKFFLKKKGLNYSVLMISNNSVSTRHDCKLNTCKIIFLNISVAAVSNKYNVIYDGCYCSLLNIFDVN